MADFTHPLLEKGDQLPSQRANPDWLMAPVWDGFGVVL